MTIYLKSMGSELVEVLVIINSPASDGTLAKAEETVSSLSLAKTINSLSTMPKKDWAREVQ
jgi:hypothetical protein